MKGVLGALVCFWSLCFLVSAAQAEESWYDRIDVGLSAAAVVQGTFNVDKDLSVKGDENRSYGAASLDLEFSTEFSSTDRAYLLFETGSGKNPEDDIASFSGIVDGALSMDQPVEISELWYEHDFALPGGDLRVRFGKVDLTTDFDTNEYANDECAQFMSPVFINNIAIDFPDYAPGAMAWFETEKVSFGVGLADAGWNNDPASYWEELFDYPFLMAELDVHTNFLNLPGNYRFYTWFNGARHDKLDGSGQDTGYGFGFSFDQELTDGVGVFFRYGWQDSDVYEVDNAVSAGVSVSGKFWGRKGDTLAVGFGVAFLSDDYEKGLRDAGDDPDDEYHLEAYYSFQVNDHLTVTPDIEWTDNPAGYSDYGSFWVVSTRVTWDF